MTEEHVDEDDPMEVLWAGLICCRTIAIFGVVATSGMIAASLSGQQYVVQTSLCRMIHVPLTPSQRIEIGGGEIGRVSYSIDWGGLECSPENVTAEMRQSCYDTMDISNLRPEADWFTEETGPAAAGAWIPFTDNPNCIAPCEDNDPILCHCAGNPWAQSVKMGDLPRYCKLSTMGGPEMGFIFIDAHDTVSGFLVWLPIITWGMIRLLGTTKELIWYFGKVDDHANFALRAFRYMAITITPGGLLGAVGDMTVCKSDPGVVFAPINVFTQQLGAIGIVLFFCFAFSFYSDYLDATTSDVDEQFSVAVYIPITFIGMCCAMVGLIFELGMFVNTGIPFGLTFEWSLEWPGLSISAYGTAVRVMRFFLLIMDTVAPLIRRAGCIMKSDTYKKLMGSAEE